MSIAWSTKYCVGSNRLDLEHEKIFHLLNKLEAALNYGKGRDVLKPMVQQFDNYMQLHFRGERKYLENMQYESYREHCALHDEFEKHLHEFRLHYDRDELEFTRHIFNYFRDWFVNHLAKEDKKFAYMKRTLHN